MVLARLGEINIFERSRRSARQSVIPGKASTTSRRHNRLGVGVLETHPRWATHPLAARQNLGFGRVL